MSRTLSKLRAAVIDDRLSNVFWRRDELIKLHGALLSRGQALVEAAVADSGCTTEEAKLELCITLINAKNAHDSLDPAAALAHEYAVARGEDAADRRTALGVVYIEPIPHTLLFSTISPLCVALAAGNCVVLQLEHVPGKVSSLLRDLLEEALDTDIFFITLAQDAHLGSLGAHVRVLQSGVAERTALTVASPAHARAVALIDRTADLEAAAKEVAAARFAFRGASPHAPDLVLVNEYVKRDFLDALVRHAIPFFAGPDSAGRSDDEIAARHGKPASAIADRLRRDKGVKCVSTSDTGSIFDVSDRSAAVLRRKIDEPLLLVHAIRSLDDGIDFAQCNDAPLLSVYAFGDAASAKYIAQSLSTHAAFANHIPFELLLGPAMPPALGTTSAALAARYDTASFTMPAPQFSRATELSATVKAVVGGRDSRALSQLHAAAMRAVVPAKRKSGPSIGFFERGILMGLGTALLPILASTLGLIWYRRHAAGLAGLV